MKKLFLFVFLFSLFASFSSTMAQNTVTATWALSTAAKRSVAISGAAIADSQKISKAYVIRDYSGTSSSQRVYCTGSGLGYWPNYTTQIDSCYTEFVLYPASGVTLNITEISMSIGNSGGSSNLRANIYYSLDNFATSTALAQTVVLPSSALTAQAFTTNIDVGSSGALYVRVYPWLNGGVASGKYFNIQNVVIKGTSSGTATVSLATLTTTAITSISTTTASGGGNISSDGGGAITERGVCWNITGSPTVSDGKTSDGTGTGIFTSSIAGLSPGSTYYVRAYAVNSAGAAYGNEVSFTTLDSLSVPTVTTSAITDILTTTATGGGSVTFDGGTTVTEKGICYNKTGAPTVADSKTSDGSGLGTFSSYLANLTQNTKYYVRAYAVNSQGTAYGEEVNFTTAIPMENVRKVVAADGTGDYTTVQAAFDAVPENYTGTWTIYVKAGTYYEKLLLSSKKINVLLQGEDRDNTILTYDDYSGKVVNSVTLGTSTSYSAAIDANDFQAKNITFQNTSTAAQAVALRSNGDRQIYNNCKIIGYQDTYYAWGGSTPGRIYMLNSYIEGTVDFIFGRDIVVFSNCTINCIRNSGTLTAASTESTYSYGLVFLNCTITAPSSGYDGNAITSFYLGRPWQNSPRTVFINCVEPDVLNSDGWLSWNVTPALYAEYNCSGSGYKPSSRVSWSSQLTAAEAAQYTIQNIFAKASGIGAADWNPETLVGIEDDAKGNRLPVSISLNQNYPNPFNPETIISYSLPKSSHVKLIVYDIIGREIAVLANEEMSAGTHQVKFSLASGKIASGVYLYRLITDNYVISKKMMAIK